MYCHLYEFSTCLKKYIYLFIYHTQADIYIYIRFVCMTNAIKESQKYN